jgi:hypothetical protein
VWCCPLFLHLRQAGPIRHDAEGSDFLELSAAVVQRDFLGRMSEAGATSMSILALVARGS